MKTINILSCIILTLFTTQVLAYYTFHDTGDLLQQDQMRLTLSPQFFTGGLSGNNVVTTLDTPFSEDANIRYLLGFGSINLHLGAYYKWVPYPDYQDQPAIGISGGPFIARYSGGTEISFRAQPFVSKHFKFAWADLHPYAALPLSMRFYEDQTDFPFQMILGSNLKTHHVKELEFSLELGFNLHRAFSYIGVGFIYFVDNKNRFLDL